MFRSEQISKHDVNKLYSLFLNKRHVINNISHILYMSHTEDLNSKKINIRYTIIFLVPKRNVYRFKYRLVALSFTPGLCKHILVRANVRKWSIWKRF